MASAWVGPLDPLGASLGGLRITIPFLFGRIVLEDGGRLSGKTRPSLQTKKTKKFEFYQTLTKTMINKRKSNKLRNH